MTDPLSEWLDAMSAKARAATPGPWPQKKWSIVNEVGKSVAECSWQHDAAYIAALPPEVVQALVECVRLAMKDPEPTSDMLDALARLRRLVKGEG